MTGTVLYEVRRARDQHELTAALELRHAVFCVEQGVPEHDELDGRDHEGIHLVAVENGELLGTCRIVMVGSTAQLSRLAVREDARRRGIATALLDLADAETRFAHGPPGRAARPDLRPRPVRAGRLPRPGAHIPRGRDRAHRDGEGPLTRRPTARHAPPGTH